MTWCNSSSHYWVTLREKIKQNTVSIIFINKNYLQNIFAPWDATLSNLCKANFALYPTHLTLRESRVGRQLWHPAACYSSQSQSLRMRSLFPQHWKRLAPKRVPWATPASHRSQRCCPRTHWESNFPPGPRSEWGLVGAHNWVYCNSIQSKC